MSTEHKAVRKSGLFLFICTYCFYLSNHQSTYLLLQATSFFPMLLLENQGCFCLSEEILSIYIYIYNLSIYLSILTLLGCFQATLFFPILHTSLRNLIFFFQNRFLRPYNKLVPGLIITIISIYLISKRFLIYRK